LKLSLKNVSKDLVASMERIELAQVSLVSRGSELVSSLSSDQGWTLTRGQTNQMALKTKHSEEVSDLDVERLVQLPATVELNGGNLHFSSLVKPDSSGHPLSAPPFLDFLKALFLYNLGKRGNPPLLHSDLLVVMWRSTGNTPFLGQSIVTIQEDLEPKALEEEVCEGEEPAVSLPTPVPSYPVTIVSSVSDSTNTGFKEAPSLFSVAVSLQVSVGEAIGEGRGVLLQYVSTNSQQGLRISGNTAGVLWLSGSSVEHLKLSLTVRAPGLYKLHSWQFRAAAMEKCDLKYFESQPQQQFLPLELSFVVQ